jgi:hypothetical protein
MLRKVEWRKQAAVLEENGFDAHAFVLRNARQVFTRENIDPLSVTRMRVAVSPSNPMTFPTYTDNLRLWDFVIRIEYDDGKEDD